MDNPAQVRAILALLFILAVLPLAAPPAAALLNPAAVYCTALNYTYTTVTGPDGMTGYCILPDNKKVEAWRFLQGKEATQYSYCTRQGYTLQTVNDSKTCQVFMTDSCVVCVLPDGSKTEITKLMKLDFRERLCSNGKCCDPKTDTTCSFATYPPGMLNSIVILVVIVIIAASVILFLHVRKKRAGTTNMKE
jgi:putative hemolysin